MSQPATSHLFTVEVYDPGVPEIGKPPMTREEAEQILRDTLYASHKNSYFSIDIKENP